MRIISGKMKGLVLDGFTIPGTRPTMDRVKESLFAMLGQALEDSVCLDLFAGSGNLGLEAMSNNAREVWFVDHNPKAVETIKKNLQKAKQKDVSTVLKMDYQEALRYFASHQKKFSIIFLDPPYQANLLNDCIRKIEEYALLEDDGFLVLEYVDWVAEESPYSIYKMRKYGNKTVEIRKKCGFNVK